MRCPHCEANLARESRDGDPVIAAKGIILKSDRLVVICPKCKGDVLLNQTIHKAVHQTTALFFRRTPTPDKS